MSEKHLTELPWKTLVTKQGVKDLGLGKALAAYADFSAAQELSKALEKLTEIMELAAKLKKTYATKDEVVTHLEEMVKEVKKTTPVLEAKAKSAATAQAKSATPVAASAKPEAAGKPSAEELEEEKEAAELKKNLKQQMLSALAQVKARAPGGTEQEEDRKPQLKFMAYLAGKNCAVVVGRQVGSATKKLLPEVAGGVSGGQYVQGECIFEKNAHTFVLAKVPGGLAKKLATALQAETGQKCKVRARSIDGSVTLDSDTDLDPDATPMTNAEQMAKFKERLTGLLPEIKAKPHLKAAPGTKDEKGLNVVASEAAYFAKNNDFAKAKQLLDLVESTLHQAAGSSPASKAAAGIPKGLVEKRKFLLTRWRRLPVDIRPEVQTFKAAVEQAVPEEDPDELGDAIEEALEVFYNELQDEIDRAINAGDMRVIKGLKARVLAHPLVKHLVENPMASGTRFQSLLIEAVDEVEAKLAA